MPAQVSCILMYVYVAPPTPVGAALGLRQRFVRWPRSAIPIRIPISISQQIRIPISTSSFHFICVRLCASLFGAVIRRLEHAELYILAASLVSGVPRSRVHMYLLREIIIRVTFAPTEKCPCDLVRDANVRCGTSVTIIVGELNGSTGPSAHSSSVSVSQARLAHGEALPLLFSYVRSTRGRSAGEKSPYRINRAPPTSRSTLVFLMLSFSSGPWRNPRSATEAI